MAAGSSTLVMLTSVATVLQTMAARKPGTASVARLTTLALKAEVDRLLAAKLNVAAGSSHAATLPPVAALAARLCMAVAARTQRKTVPHHVTVAARTQRTMARLHRMTVAAREQRS